MEISIKCNEEELKIFFCEADKFRRRFLDVNENSRRMMNVEDMISSLSKRIAENNKAVLCLFQKIDEVLKGAEDERI